MRHEQEQQGPVLIVIERLVDAFCEAYDPCESECVADEIYTIARLRDFFMAYAPALGFIDPLKEYLDLLADRGYILHVCSLGTPAIFVTLKE